MFNQRLTTKNTPVDWLLENGFLPGFGLTIYGLVRPEANRFSVNLKSRCGENQSIALSVSPRFDEGQVITETYRRGECGGTPTVSKDIPLKKNSEFTLSLYCDKTDIQIMFDGHLFGRYDHFIEPQEINCLSIDGDVLLLNIVYRSQKNVPTDFYDQLLPIGPQTESWELVNGFFDGCSLTIKARTTKDAQRHDINLRTKSGDIAFHLNPRFTENEVVRNAYLECGWGEEERFNGFPLNEDSDFSVEIVCEASGFQISYDEVLFACFNHRVEPEKITSLDIEGGIEIKEIIYKSKRR